MDPILDSDDPDPSGGTQATEPFRVEPHSFGFKSGIDLDKLNQLVDELEVSEALRKLGK